MKARYVIGPDGSPLTLADLPPSSTKRWVAKRKAQVVIAVRSGLLSIQEAAKRYMLSEDEYMAWQREYDRLGLDGLKATRLQTNRA